MIDCSYQDVMEKEQAFLTVTLDLSDPIEIGMLKTLESGMLISEKARRN